jgi:peptidoglycan/xylan/chitin deacetylase (PgdA/CDA1 family)
MLAFAITGAAIGGAVAAAAAGCFHSISPTSRLYGRTFTGLPHAGKQLALTYDDGPNDPYTLELLETLSRHKVRATFFVIGQHVRRRPDIVREMANAGHVIGNHTFTHPMLTFQAKAEIRSQLSNCRAALEEAIGAHSNLFRPPFGGRRPAVLRVARELGLEPIMWSVTGYDWNAPPAVMIESKVRSQIRGGDVILLHDGGHKEMGADRSQTVHATDLLLKRYLDEGYQFVTIPEMMEKAGSHRPLSVGQIVAESTADSK